jgi:hypothetical protein
MVEGCESHPLQQVIPHPWGTNNGKAQFGASDLQKGELLKLLPTLPIRHLSLTFSIGRRIRQAVGILLGQL